eukprot:973198-Rhodomonas_salina.3
MLTRNHNPDQRRQYAICCQLDGSWSSRSGISFEQDTSMVGTKAAAAHRGRRTHDASLQCWSVPRRRAAKFQKVVLELLCRLGGTITTISTHVPGRTDTANPQSKFEAKWREVHACAAALRTGDAMKLTDGRSSIRLQVQSLMPRLRLCRMGKCLGWVLFAAMILAWNQTLECISTGADFTQRRTLHSSQVDQILVPSLRLRGGIGKMKVLHRGVGKRAQTAPEVDLAQEVANILGDTPPVATTEPASVQIQ